MPVGAYAGANVSIGNGVTTAFPYNFKITDQTHLEVKVDGVLKVLGADYTVTGVALSNGGNVVFGVAPANGAVVQRARKVPYVRVQDYQNNGDFKEVTVDGDLDTIEMQVQQLAADIARAFKAPLSVTADQVLADANWAARAGKFLGFDGAGALGALSGTMTGVAIEAVHQVVNTIATLKARAVPTVAEVVFVLGYYAAMDLGGGSYYWDAASAAADNGGTVIRPNSAPAVGRWRLKHNGRVTAGQFGAKGDGVADDVAAINAGAAAMAQLCFDPGKYRIASAISGGTCSLIGVPILGATFGFGVHIFVDYTEGVAENAAILFDGAGAATNGNGCAVRDLIIWKAITRVGGTAIKFTGSSTALRAGFPMVDNVRITGDGTWSHGIVVDGTAMTTVGTQGLRDCTLRNTWVFNTTVADKSIWVKNGAQFSMIGGGIVDGLGANSGMTITGAAGATSTSQNVSGAGVYIGGTLTLDYVNNFALEGFVVGGAVSITANATNGDVNGRFAGAVTNASSLGTPVFVNGEQTGVWAPVPTNLAIVGGPPIYSGYFTRTRNMLHWNMTVDANGGTTASTAVNTTFAGIPVAAAVPGVCVATDTGVANLGNGLVQNVTVYPPAWAARANTVMLSGSFRIAAP